MPSLTMSFLCTGGGVLAHTILGVDYSRDSGELRFLVLDPHYTGVDDLRTVQQKVSTSEPNIEIKISQN